MRPTGFDNAAFPIPEQWDEPGMTMREWYAGQALAMIGTMPKNWMGSQQQIAAAMAQWAFEIADAMLAEARKSR